MQPKTCRHILCTNNIITTYNSGKAIFFQRRHMKPPQPPPVLSSQSNVKCYWCTKHAYLFSVALLIYLTKNRYLSSQSLKKPPQYTKMSKTSVLYRSFQLFACTNSTAKNQSLHYELFAVGTLPDHYF